MSGGSKTTTNNTSSNTIDPQSMAMLQGNYSTAQNNAGILAQPYPGQLTAGFTPTQVAAQGQLTGVATDPTYANNSAQATDAVSGILGAQPMNTTVNAQPVNASTIANTNLAPYENPFQSDVINATMGQIGQQRNTAMNSDTQSAIAANAFGNNRLGVNQALTNQLYDQDTASTLAGLNSANFTQAQAAAGQDANTNNSVNEFNSGQNVNAQQSSIANAQNKEGILNSSATNLSNLNTAALGNAATQGGILASVGDAQQGQQQTELTNAYNAYMQGKQLTIDQQNLLNSALGMIPVQQTVNSSGTSNTTTNPGLGGILGSLGQIGMSAAALA